MLLSSEVSGLTEETSSESFLTSFFFLLVPGRRYAVDLHYTAQPEANYIHAATTTVFQIHTIQPKGDILVFLTGQDEIESMEENLKETAYALGDKVAELIIAPIYANLPSDQQSKIFEPTPPGARKVSILCLSAHRGFQLILPLMLTGRTRYKYRRNVHHHRRCGLRHRSRLRQAKQLQPKDWNGVSSCRADLACLRSATFRKSRASRSREGFQAIHQVGIQ